MSQAFRKNQARTLRRLPDLVSNVTQRRERRARQAHYYQENVRILDAREGYSSEPAQGDKVPEAQTSRNSTLQASAVGCTPAAASSGRQRV
eukprot:scaffold176804_cov35-Tisochrysis_lutea.AAC.3